MHTPTSFRKKLILLAIFLIGCESDPILAPQTKQTEEKGSYGIIIFDPKDKDKASSVNNKADTRNPKLF